MLFLLHSFKFYSPAAFVYNLFSTSITFTKKFTWQRLWIIQSHLRKNTCRLTCKSAQLNIIIWQKIWQIFFLFWDFKNIHAFNHFAWSMKISFHNKTAIQFDDVRLNWITSVNAVRQVFPAQEHRRTYSTYSIMSTNILQITPSHTTGYNIFMYIVVLRFFYSCFSSTYLLPPCEISHPSE